MAKKKPQKPKKNSLFGNRKLDKATRARIEKQLAESRERDIRAMQEKNKLLREKAEKRQQAKERLRKYKENPRGEKTGLSAHNKYDIIMQSMSKAQQSALRNYESGDFIDVADYLSWEKGRISYNEMIKKLKEIDEAPYYLNVLNDKNNPLENKKDETDRRNPF